MRKELSKTENCVYSLILFRYYRRPGNLSKKPSALCLPVACQPDPAIYRRVRRSPVESQYHPQETAKQTTNEQTDVNRVDDRGDVNTTATDLDHMLARYEKIFSEIPSTSRKNEAGATAIKNVGGLKPRVSRILLELLVSNKELCCFSKGSSIDKGKARKVTQNEGFDESGQ